MLSNNYLVIIKMKIVIFDWTGRLLMYKTSIPIAISDNQRIIPLFLTPQPQNSPATFGFVSLFILKIFRKIFPEYPGAFLRDRLLTRNNLDQYSIILSLIIVLMLCEWITGLRITAYISLH